MNSKQRAAQIWCKPYMASQEMDVQLAELIAAEIQAAVDEARNTTHCKVRCGCFAYESAYKRGVEEERKACAKACEEHVNERELDPLQNWTCETLAAIIRARTGEPHKAGEDLK